MFSQGEHRAVNTRESGELSTRQKEDPRLSDRRGVSDRQGPGGIRDWKASEQS